MPEIPLPPLAEVLELLPPAGAALVLFVIGAWLGRRGSPRWFAVLSVVAIAVAYAWTFVRLVGAPAVPPIQSTERGLFAVLAGAMLALTPAISRLGFQRRVGLQIIAAFVAVLAVAGGIISPAIKPWPLAAAGLGAVAYFLLLDRASFRPAPVFCFSLAAAVGATGEVFLMFGGALVGQLAGVIAITMGLVAVASLFFRGPLPAVAALPLAAIVVALSVDAALFMYAPPPLIALVLLAAGPLAPLVIPPRLSERLRWKATALGLVLSLAVTGLGFFVAWRVAPEPWG